jgi:hypothetical protein
MNFEESAMTNSQHWLRNSIGVQLKLPQRSLITGNSEALFPLVRVDNHVEREAMIDSAYGLYAFRKVNHA